MENKTMIELVQDLKTVVNGQVQVRTNKLKPLVEAMESKSLEGQSDKVSTSEEALMYTITTDTEKELLEAIRAMTENYGITIHEALQTIEEKVKNKDPEAKNSEGMTSEDVESENRYLKRKLTMYELKIGKREATIKEQDTLIKGYKKGVQATIFDV